MEKCKKFTTIPASMWIDKFELLDESLSASDVKDYFEHIIKTHETVTDNPPIRIFVNKIENKITFKTKIGYYLEQKQLKMKMKIKQRF